MAVTEHNDVVLFRIVDRHAHNLCVVACCLKETMYRTSVNQFHCVIGGIPRRRTNQYALLVFLPLAL